jgi:hypothetical protein
MCLALAEAQTAQRAKCLRLRVGVRGRRRCAVGRAIRMQKLEFLLCGARRHQSALVQRTVMGSAKSDQVARLVAATVRSRENMMNVHESCVRATWHATPMAITPQHHTSCRWGDVLGCPSRGGVFDCAHVGSRRNALCVAVGHRYHCLRYLDELAVGVLPCALTNFAHVERYLVARAAVVARSAEHVTRQE